MPFVISAFCIRRCLGFSKFKSAGGGVMISTGAVAGAGDCGRALTPSPALLLVVSFGWASLIASGLLTLECASALFVLAELAINTPIAIKQTLSTPVFVRMPVARAMREPSH